MARIVGSLNLRGAANQIRDRVVSTAFEMVQVHADTTDQRMRALDDALGAVIRRDPSLGIQIEGATLKLYARNVTTIIGPSKSTVAGPSETALSMYDAARGTYGILGSSSLGFVNPTGSLPVSLYEIPGSGGTLSLSDGTPTPANFVNVFGAFGQIQATGDVGVGTLRIQTGGAATGAITKLDIYSDGVTAKGELIRLINLSGVNTANPRIGFETNFGGVNIDTWWNIGVRNGSNQFGVFDGGSPISFGAERLTIKIGGNVGINKTNPLFQLHVGGRACYGVPNSAPTDGDIGTSEVTAYLNEAGNTLRFRVRYSDGTTLKVGEIALV